MAHEHEMNQTQLYQALCLAADEYTSFRNGMMRTPTVTVQQVEQAIKRADRVIGLLKVLRGRQAAGLP